MEVTLTTQKVQVDIDDRMTVSLGIAEKAQRLLTENRVARIKGSTYAVKGDTDMHVVMVGYAPEGSGRCTCPANMHNPEKVCSHILAACAFEIANPVPASTITDPFDF
jgi:hypothetical protein